MKNPLLQSSPHKHGAVPFDQIKPEHFLPAMEAAIETAKREFEQYKLKQDVSFEHVILEKNKITETVDRVAGIYFNLHSSECTEELEKISEKMSDLATKFSNDISLDPIIFEKVKKCFETQIAKLSAEEKMIVEKTYKGFVRNGALLTPEKKEKLREIDEKLSKLSLQFSQNVLKATNDYLLVLDKKEDLIGLPEAQIEAAAELAEKKNHAGKWCVSLDAPSMIPFMTYSQRRDLREKLFKANGSKNFHSSFDNQQNIRDIVNLRLERANLLGYKTHADYVLEERMAMTSEKVMSFLNDFLTKAKPQAMKEIEKLKKLAHELDKIEDFQPYDSAYYSEILLKRELNFDDEILRPYFQLEKVVDGIIEVSHKLFDLRFKELFDTPKYHEDVRLFEVTDEASGKYVGLFYMDFFPRATKRGGAWMSGFKDQGFNFGGDDRPHVTITCNFTKPTKTKPSLLTLNEVQTLYHEFGHALHGLLSNCRYKDLSGTNVLWDFVELPSQMFENWTLEKECLDLFAVHHETGEKIPSDLVERIKKSSQFLEGIGTMRQLTFGLLDMTYHTRTSPLTEEIQDFEANAVKETTLLPRLPEVNVSTSFSHIFAGGYSAGYYSYKWAEVLDADAFDYFKENGIFNKEIAKKYRTHILERGGTEHPMELYKKFRGQEPDVRALLKRAGLIQI